MEHTLQGYLLKIRKTSGAFGGKTYTMSDSWALLLLLLLLLRSSHGYFCFSAPRLRRKSSCFGSEFLPSLIRILVFFFFLLFLLSSSFSSGAQMSSSTLLAPSDEEMASLLCQFDVLQEVIRRKHSISNVWLRSRNRPRMCLLIWNAILNLNSISLLS